MDEIELNAYKKILFNTMKVFIEVCEKYNINYFACSGTAIGAVRHNGCIPWDDDIDVLMLRKDYEKLLSIKESMKGTGYAIFSHSDNGFPLPYAKFCNMNTTLWENKEHPFIEGVFIDIFPLDEASSDTNITRIRVNEYKKTWRRYEYSISKFSFKDFMHSLLKRDWVLSGHILLCTLHYRWHKRKYYNKFTELDNKIQKIKGDRLIHYFCSYSIERELFAKEWFEGYSEMNYEDFVVRLPKNYDCYLKQLFGDYMKLPPKEHRHSFHHHYYLNLEKHINIK